MKGGLFGPCVIQYCSIPVDGGFLCTHVSSSVLFIAVSHYNLHRLNVQQVCIPCCHGDRLICIGSCI